MMWLSEGGRKINKKRKKHKFEKDGKMLKQRGQVHETWPRPWKPMYRFLHWWGRFGCQRQIKTMNKTYCTMIRIKKRGSNAVHVEEITKTSVILTGVSFILSNLFIQTVGFCCVQEKLAMSLTTNRASVVFMFYSLCVLSVPLLLLFWSRARHTSLFPPFTTKACQHNPQVCVRSVTGATQPQLGLAANAAPHHGTWAPQVGSPVLTLSSCWTLSRKSLLNCY